MAITHRLKPSDVLTKKEAADLAKVTPRTISRWLADDDIPLTRYNVQINRVAISRKELVQLLSARAAN